MWVLLLSLASACAGGGEATRPRVGIGQPPTARPDRALELALYLPSSADECVALRAARVPAARREAFQQLSQADSLAFASSLRIKAFVSARRSRRGRRSGQVMVLLLGVPNDQARGLLSELRPSLRWTPAAAVGPWDEGCGPGGCPGRVQFLGPGILKIELGPWRAPAGARGVEARCRALLSGHPDALEVSAQRGLRLADSAFSTTPLRGSRVVRASARGLDVLSRDMLASSDAAERFVQVRRSADQLMFEGGGVFSDVSRRVEDAWVSTRMGVLWEDLELQVEDAARLEQAEQDADSLERLQPFGEIDAGDLVAVLWQLTYRLDHMAHLAGAERRQHALELRGLLERALAVHPAEPRLARPLLDLLLGELEDAQAAAALAGRMHSQVKADTGVDWRQLRRRALGLDSARALAEALVEDGIVGRDAAAVAAEQLTALVARGLEYTRAERAWARSDGLVARAPRLLPLKGEPPTLQLSGLLPALLFLRSLGGPTGAMSMVLRAGDRGRLEPQLPSGPGYLFLDRDERPALWLPDVAASDAQRQLAQLLGVLGWERLEILVERAKGQPPLRLAGRLEGERWHLEAVDGRSLRVDWALLRAHVFDPMSLPGLRSFRVFARDEAVAQRMIHVASGAFGLRCDRKGKRVRCRAPLGARANVGAALRAAVAPTVSAAAKRLWGHRGGAGRRPGGVLEPAP